MFRPCRPILALGSLAVVAGLALGRGPTSAAGQQGKAVVVFSRDIKVTLDNVDLKDPLGPGVRGEGTFPVRLTVHDRSVDTEVRRIQILVAVYTRPDPTSLRAGDEIIVRRLKETMETEPGEEGIHQFAEDIVVEPGSYVVKVFACDPDMEYDEESLRPPIPAPDRVPGMVLSMRAVAVHVQANP